MKAATNRGIETRREIDKDLTTLSNPKTKTDHKDILQRKRSIDAKRILMINLEIRKTEKIPNLNIGIGVTNLKPVQKNPVTKSIRNPRRNPEKKRVFPQELMMKALRRRHGKKRKTVVMNLILNPNAN